MTWKEFKEEVEKQGVTDDMDFLYIDTCGYDVRVKILKDDKFIVQ